MPNKKGGKKFKRGKKETLDRKLITKNPKEDQEYAKIKSVNGSGRYQVFCFDGVDRLGISAGNIRKKTRIGLNDIVLVSLREWQDSVCDIIDNYDENLTRKLKEKGLVPKSINVDVDNQYSDDDEDNRTCEFSTDIPDSESDEEEENLKNKYSSSNSEESDDGKIDIDDI